MSIRQVCLARGIDLRRTVELPKSPPKSASRRSPRNPFLHTRVDLLLPKIVANRKPRALTEWDSLLGVHDETRLGSERLSLRPRLLMSEPYLRDEMPGCSQEKTKSVIPGNILVINPIRGATPKPTILNQNSDPNSPGFVLVTWLNVASRCISA